MKSLSKYIFEELKDREKYIERFDDAITNLDNSDESFLNIKLQEIKYKSIRNYLEDRELNNIKDVIDIIFNNNKYIAAMFDIIKINSGENPITGESLKSQLELEPKSFFDILRELGLNEAAIKLLFEIFPIKTSSGKTVGPGEYALRLLLSDYKKYGTGGVDIQNKKGDIKFEVKFINVLNINSSAKIFGEGAVPKDKQLITPSEFNEYLKSDAQFNSNANVQAEYLKERYNNYLNNTSGLILFIKISEGINGINVSLLPHEVSDIDDIRNIIAINKLKISKWSNKIEIKALK